MANFTAKDVQALRQATGAGMMDAKKALEETGGDAEAAAKLLRERGLASSAKRSGSRYFLSSESHHSMALMRRCLAIKAQTNISNSSSFVMLGLLAQ